MNCLFCLIPKSALQEEIDEHYGLPLLGTLEVISWQRVLMAIEEDTRGMWDLQNL